MFLIKKKEKEKKREKKKKQAKILFTLKTVYTV